MPATATLASRMETLHVPGVSIAVIHDGKLEWAAGFGVTRLGGPAVTPDTLFQAASISKPVSAFALMRLVQEGKLRLDADVNDHLKSWKMPQNEFTRQAPVTLRGLLNHTAGVTVHGFPGYATGTAIPTLVEVLNGNGVAEGSPAIVVDKVPGASWRYSGGGYLIAQQAAQDVTGLAFPELMKHLVLRPLGMTRSTYEQPLPSALMGSAATPYAATGMAVPGGDMSIGVGRRLAVDDAFGSRPVHDRGAACSRGKGQRRVIGRNRADHVGFVLRPAVDRILRGRER